MTRKEFLDDMIAFYSADPVGRRSVFVKDNDDTRRCLYRGPDGRKCAIGRHIPDIAYTEDMEGQSVKFHADDVNGVLPASIAHLGCVFLRAVQTLHDEDMYWDQSGLSEDGRKAVTDIQSRFIS